jgi:hypothetical protein
MPRITHEQLPAHDDEGGRHLVMVTRTSVPGAPHLYGPTHYSWNHGEPLHLVDPKAGVLENALGERLQIENWRG